MQKGNFLCPQRLFLPFILSTLDAARSPPDPQTTSDSIGRLESISG